MSVLNPTVAPVPASPPPVPAPDPDVPAHPIYRLSVAQYHAMIDAGILQDGDPVELLEGWLVLKMTKHPPHVFANESLRDLLAALVPSGFFVNAQEPVTTDTSEPEPDLAVIRGLRRQFVTANPGPQDTALAVEVADTSLGRDRTVKLRIYARNAVPVYWIVNLVDRQVEVYTEPTGPAPDPTYRRHTDYAADAEVPLVLDGQEVGRVPVRDLLP